MDLPQTNSAAKIPARILIKYPTFIVMTANILSHQPHLPGKKGSYIKYPTPKTNTVIPAPGRSVLKLHRRPPHPF
jgi:hypothetical protein